LSNYISRVPLWWVEIGQQPSTHTAACSLPPIAWGESRRKERGLMDGNGDGLISKEKAARASKAK